MTRIMKKYSLILADPCWEYDNKQQHNPARGGITYDTLSMKALCELPVVNIAAPNSILVMWCTFPKLCDKYYERYDPLEVMRAWGFRPLTALFVWIKTNKGGGYYSGLGRYTNSNAEFALVGRRGKGLPRLAKNVKQLIVAPIGRHSEKPREQYDRLFSLYGDVPRIELFARAQNAPPAGWDAIGLEYDNTDIRDFLRNNYASVCKSNTKNDGKSIGRSSCSVSCKEGTRSNNFVS